MFPEVSGQIICLLFQLHCYTVLPCYPHTDLAQASAIMLVPVWLKNRYQVSPWFMLTGPLKNVSYQTNMGFILTKILAGHTFKIVIFATIYNIVLDTLLFSPPQHSGPSDWPNPTALCAIHLALHHLQSPRFISSGLYSWHNYPSSPKPLHHHQSPSITLNQNLTQTLPLY